MQLEKIMENLETTSPNCWRIVAGQPHWHKVMRNSSLKPPRPRFEGKIMFSKPVSQLPFLPMFQNVPDRWLFCHIALFAGCSEVCHTLCGHVPDELFQSQPWFHRIFDGSLQKTPTLTFLVATRTPKVTNNMNIELQFQTRLQSFSCSATTSELPSCLSCVLCQVD